MSSSAVITAAPGNSRSVGMSFLYERMSLHQRMSRPYLFNPIRLSGRSASPPGYCSRASQSTRTSGLQVCMSSDSITRCTVLVLAGNVVSEITRGTSWCSAERPEYPASDECFDQRILWIAGTRGATALSRAHLADGPTPTCRNVWICFRIGKLAPICRTRRPCQWRQNFVEGA